MTYDLSDPADWLLQYNHTLNTLKSLNDKAKSTTNVLNTKDRAKMRKSLKDAKRDVMDMRDNINILHTITKSDKQSRRDKCDELTELLQQVERNLSSQKGKVGELLDQREKRYRNWKPGQEPEEISGMENRQVLAYQNQVMEEQDKSAAILSTALGRIKNLGQQIGDELDEHTVLLGELNDDTKRTTKNIERQNRRMDKLIKQARVPLSLCVIICLVIVLVVILVLVLKFMVFNS